MPAWPLRMIAFSDHAFDVKSTGLSTATVTTPRSYRSIASSERGVSEDTFVVRHVLNLFKQSSLGESTAIDWIVGTQASILSRFA